MSNVYRQPHVGSNHGPVAGQSTKLRIAALATLAEPQLQPAAVNADEAGGDGHWPEYEQPPPLRDTIRALERSAPNSETGVFIHGNDPRRIGAVAADALNVIDDPSRFADQMFQLYVAIDRQNNPGTITVPLFVPRGTDEGYPDHDALRFKLRISEDMDFVIAENHNVPHDVYTVIEATFRIMQPVKPAPTLGGGASLTEHLSALLKHHRGNVTLELDTDNGFVAVGDGFRRGIPEATVVEGITGRQHTSHWNTFPGRVYLIKCAADAVIDTPMITQSPTGRYMLKRGFVDLGAHASFLGGS